jgi:membrane protein
VTRHGLSAQSLQTVVGSLWVKQGIVLGFSTLAFTFLLRFMPNTRVHPIPALVGGCCTAVLFTVWLRLCTLMQVGIVKYSLIYGGFALLPILLAWIYVSWEIVMLGAHIACTMQYGSVCPTARHGQPASPRSRLLLAMALCAGAAQHVQQAGAPLDAEQFIRTHHLPARLTRSLISELVAAGFLAEVAGAPGHYLPLYAPEKLTVAALAQHVFDDGLSPDELGMHRLDPGLTAVTCELEQVLAAHFRRPVAHGEGDGDR